MNTVMQHLGPQGFGYYADSTQLPGPVAQPPRSKIEVGVGLALAGLLLYAGYRRGIHVEESCGDKCAMVLPTLGWSLLGPVGPGYLVGRLVSPQHGG